MQPLPEEYRAKRVALESSVAAARARLTATKEPLDAAQRASTELQVALQQQQLAALHVIAQRQKREHLRLRDLLKRCKDDLVSEGDAEGFLGTLLSSCLIPRVMQSSVDALYAARFIHLLRVTAFPHLRVIKLYHNVLATLPALLAGCTCAEASRMGVFVAELFSPLRAWATEQRQFAADVEGNSTFALIDTKTGKESIVQQWKLESVVFSFHNILTLVLTRKFASPVMHGVTTALFFLSKLTSVFPLAPAHFETLGSALQLLADKHRQPEHANPMLVTLATRVGSAVANAAKNALTTGAFVKKMPAKAAVGAPAGSGVSSATTSAAPSGSAPVVTSSSSSSSAGAGAGTRPPPRDAMAVSNARREQRQLQQQTTSRELSGSGGGRGGSWNDSRDPRPSRGDARMPAAAPRAGQDAHPSDRDSAHHDSRGGGRSAPAAATADRSPPYSHPLAHAQPGSRPSQSQQRPILALPRGHPPKTQQQPLLSHPQRSNSPPASSAHPARIHDRPPHGWDARDGDSRDARGGRDDRDRADRGSHGYEYEGAPRGAREDDRERREMPPPGKRRLDDRDDRRFEGRGGDERRGGHGKRPRGRD
jgi:hypothetical protein